MIYTIQGKFKLQRENFVVIDVNGIGFKIFTTNETINILKQSKQLINMFCFVYLRENLIDLYGFIDEPSLKLFELLNSVSGIGPKTALSILNAGPIEHIMAAIVNNKKDILQKMTGIGAKTAERLILELKEKIKMSPDKDLTKSLEIDQEVRDVLISLGYNDKDILAILKQLPPEAKSLEQKIKSALKLLTKH
ncbi:MAG: Holliday junction branch migration protein RuvA [Minisyncoccia bacterium]